MAEYTEDQAEQEAIDKRKKADLIKAELEAVDKITAAAWKKIKVK